MYITTKSTKKYKLFDNKRQISKFTFSLCAVILPLIQFCVFYIYANSNMFVLAFQKYQAKQGSLGYDVSFVFLDNFRMAWNFIVENTFMIRNSLIKYVFCTLLSMGLSLIFSFYLYKKFFAHKFFKVILFMPQVISGMVFALIFKYIVTDVYTSIVTIITGSVDVVGLFDNVDTRFPTVIFFNVWTSFGVNIMLFTSAMNGINESVEESASLDGANIYKEFIHITLPLIFPTITSLLVLGLVGIFTDQMNLYTLFGRNGEEMSTFGYYLYLQSVDSDLISTKVGLLNYSELSALGIILTIIILPITMTVKKLLEKFGPSVE